MHVLLVEIAFVTAFILENHFYGIFTVPFRGTEFAMVILNNM